MTPVTLVIQSGPPLRGYVFQHTCKGRADKSDVSVLGKLMQSRMSRCLLMGQSPMMFM
jgi:hypothetical protein